MKNNKNNDIIYTNLTNEDIIKAKYLKWNKTKITIAKIITALMIIAALLLSKYVLTPSENKSAQNWVYDTNNILGDITINEINGRNQVLYSESGSKSEIVVVVEKGKLGDKDMFKRADKLFKKYKVSDGGILMLISVPEVPSSHSSNNALEEWGQDVEDFFNDLFGNEKQPFAYSRGRNVNNSLSNSEIENIFRDYFNTNYQSGNYNTAVLNTFNALADYMENGYISDKVQTYASNTPIESGEIESVLSAGNTQTTTSSRLSASPILGIIIIFIVLFIIFGFLSKGKRRIKRSIRRNIRRNSNTIKWNDFFSN